MRASISFVAKIFTKLIALASVVKQRLHYMIYIKTIHRLQLDQETVRNRMVWNEVDVNNRLWLYAFYSSIQTSHTLSAAISTTTIAAAATAVVWVILVCISQWLLYYLYIQSMQVSSDMCVMLEWALLCEIVLRACDCVRFWAATFTWMLNVSVLKYTDFDHALVLCSC